MYSQKVMERFKNPKHLKKMKNPDAVGTVGNAICGDMMYVYIKVDKKGGKEIIKDISVQTFGCVAAISTSDVVCDLALGKTLEEARKISKDDIIKELGSLPEIKTHCSVLAQNGLIKAIDNYKKKQDTTT
ncbi:iron-sulfur cluster assembly scaffold protein [Candidatus Woesearchaeota archaeon]|nr:iron-sulfur cluster assembly scaffold protein [Candidatus Woesearchaeota archaeon]